MNELNAGVFIGLLIGLFACILVFGLTDSHWKREAVKAGKAEYYLDETNERQWRWK